MTGDRTGALARADGGSFQLSSGESHRLLPCVVSADGPESALWIPEGRLLTPLPGGTVAFDRNSVGGWELLVREPTLLGQAAFARLEARRDTPLNASDLPADIASVRAVALPEPELRDAVGHLACRPDYPCIFPAIRLAISRGQGRSVWHSRLHLAAGIAHYGWEIGDHTYGAPTVIDGEHGSLRIGRYCSIAGDVRIVLANHATETATTYPFAALRRHWPSAPDDVPDHVGAGVTIGNSVWIGAGATILPGARVGDGAIIGAEAVVARDVPPYGVMVGNPARLTRRRFDERTIERLLALRWWDWPDEKVDRFVPMLLSKDIGGFLAAAEGVSEVARAA